MLTEPTSKTQLPPPKAILSDFEDMELAYFDVIGENGCTMLIPVRITHAGAVRAKLAELGLSEADVTEEVAWALQQGRTCDSHARRNRCRFRVDLYSKESPPKRKGAHDDQIRRK